MKVCAMDVHKGRTSRTLFQRETSKKKESYNSFIQMCVAQCHNAPLVGMYTMHLLLMIILIRPGCTFLNQKMKCSVNSRNSNP
jgi:hypothetical protein